MLRPRDVVSGEWRGNGAEGTRTPGLHSAIVALSQLSYSPRLDFNSTPEWGYVKRDYDEYEISIIAATIS